MKNKDEDRVWLDTLSGKQDVEANRDGTRHTELLRLAIQKYDKALGVAEFDIEAGLQKLKFRMRQENLSDAVLSNVLDMPAAMRANRHREVTAEVVKHFGGSPMQFVSNLRREYSSFFWIYRLPESISELELLGIDRNLANKLWGLIGQGYEEEEVVASFLHALSEIIDGKRFGRLLKRTIFNRWKKTVKTQSVDIEVKGVLAQVSSESWT